MYSSEFFSKMQAKALDRWDDVEKKTGTKLLQENGLLFYGEDTGETVEGSVLGAKEVMEKLGLPHKFYATGDEIADAYPALEGCRGKPYSGVCEDTAGHIRASKACNALAQGAGDLCDVKLNSKIVSLNAEGPSGKVVAVTEDGVSLLELCIAGSQFDLYTLNPWFLLSTACRKPSLLTMQLLHQALGQTMYLSLPTCLS